MKINPTKIVHEVIKWVDNEVKRPSRVNTRDIHPRVSQVNRGTEHANNVRFVIFKKERGGVMHAKARSK
jgi:hypothetical protein